MTDLVIVLILAVIVGAAAGYIFKAKKHGQKCIGCPVSSCPSKQNGAAGCCGCSACGGQKKPEK